MKGKGCFDAAIKFVFRTVTPFRRQREHAARVPPPPPSPRHPVLINEQKGVSRLKYRPRRGRTIVFSELRQLKSDPLRNRLLRGL